MLGSFACRIDILGLELLLLDSLLNHVALDEARDMGKVFLPLLFGNAVALFQNAHSETE